MCNIGQHALCCLGSSYTSRTNSTLKSQGQAIGLKSNLQVYFFFIFQLKTSLVLPSMFFLVTIQNISYHFFL